MGAAGLDSIPYKRVGHLAPGEARAFSMTCIPRLPGIHVVTLSVQIRSDNGLSSSYELTDELHIVVSRSLDAQEGMTVEVQGAAIVDGPLPSNVRHLIIQGDAILENLGGITAKEADSKDSDVRVANTPPAEKDVAEVKLQATFDGLSPLDFKAFAVAWRKAGRTLVNSFQFINDDGDAMTQPAIRCSLAECDAEHFACDHYRLRLITYGLGYITLVLRGTSGKHFIGHPNSHGESVSADPRQVAYFPDPPASLASLEGVISLLRMPLLDVPDMEGANCLCFTGTGIEQALVLITAEPILSEAEPLIVNGILNYKPQPYIKALLQKAAAQHDSELGFAEIEVVER